MTIGTKNVPEHHRKTLQCKIRNRDRIQALLDFRMFLSRHTDAGQVAFNVSGNYRYTGTRKSFSENLQSYRFAGTGGAGDQSMPVTEFAQLADQFFTSRADNDFCC